MRVVLDPNVIISALLSTGTTAAILDAWLDHRAYELVVCPLLLEELTEVLARPKFAALGSEVVLALLERLGGETDRVQDPSIEVGTTTDPDDDYLIALARAANADHLVSGDSQLRQSSVSDVSVISPTEFLAILEEGQ